MQTPDGTVITSYHRYEFVSHNDANGLRYFVDGGLEYARRSLHKNTPCKDLSVYDDDNFLIIRESFHWAKYELNNSSPLWVPLSCLDTVNIKCILSEGLKLPEFQKTFLNKSWLIV